MIIFEPTGAGKGFVITEHQDVGGGALLVLNKWRKPARIKPGAATFPHKNTNWVLVSEHDVEYVEYQEAR